jgi:hypothetical protein
MRKECEIVCKKEVNEDSFPSLLYVQCVVKNESKSESSDFSFMQNEDSKEEIKGFGLCDEKVGMSITKRKSDANYSISSLSDIAENQLPHPIHDTERSH